MINNNDEIKKTVDEMCIKVFEYIIELCLGGLIRFLSGDNSNVKKKLYNNKKGENNNED